MHLSEINSQSSRAENVIYTTFVFIEKWQSEHFSPERADGNVSIQQWRQC